MPVLVAGKPIRHADPCRDPPRNPWGQVTPFFSHWQPPHTPGTREDEGLAPQVLRQARGKEHCTAASNHHQRVLRRSILQEQVCLELQRAAHGVGGGRDDDGQLRQHPQRAWQAPGFYPIQQDSRPTPRGAGALRDRPAAVRVLLRLRRLFPQPQQPGVRVTWCSGAATQSAAGAALRRPRIGSPSPQTVTRACTPPPPPLLAHLSSPSQVAATEPRTSPTVKSAVNSRAVLPRSGM